MDDNMEINADDLLGRLLAVMPARWVGVILSRLERVCTDTGYGEVTIYIHAGKVIQVNGTVKEK